MKDRATNKGKGHNLTTVLEKAAFDIAQEHDELMALFETGQAKAERIGQLLLQIKPTLKETGSSINEFCQSYLPFSKSAAYEYMSIANGKATLADLTARKKNSAPAENSSAVLLAESLKDLRQEAEDFGAGLALLNGMKFNHDHPNKTELLKTVEGEWDSYNFGFIFALSYSILGDMKADALKKGNIAGAKTLTSQQDVLFKALRLSHDEVTMLHALMLPDEANMEGLRDGGHISNHPLQEAYRDLFPMLGRGLENNTSSQAEAWCSEAMFETAIDYHENEGNQATADELRKLKTPKHPRTAFWILSTTAAKTLKGN